MFEVFHPPAEAPGDPAGAAPTPETATLAAALDGLAAVEPVDQPGAVLGAELVALHALRDRLEAQIHRRVSAFDASGAWQHDAAVTPAAWLRHACRLDHPVAARTVRLARRLTRLPATAVAYTAGHLSTEAARIIAATVAAVPAEHRAVVETVMVGYATGQPTDPAGPTGAAAAGGHAPAQLRQLAAAVRSRVDPDGGLAAAERAHADQWLAIAPLLDGLATISGQLDIEGADTLRAALDALTPPPEPGDTRTAGHRRALALIELARQALDRAADDSDLGQVAGQRPHVTLLIPWQTLQDYVEDHTAHTLAPQHDTAALLDIPAGELGRWRPLALLPSGPVSVQTAQRIACDCALSRIVLGPDGLPLDAGRTTRTVTHAIRRALHVRDRGCRWPGCDRPPSWCDAHHVLFWHRGGRTSLDNFVLLCRRHHRALHEGGWVMTLHPDATLQVHHPLRPAHRLFSRPPPPLR